MRKLFCFDMDMTLLEHKTYRIPDSAMWSLKELREKGHLIAIATGRDLDNELSRHLAKLVKPDAIVHANGLRVTLEGRTIYEQHMEKDLIEKLLRYGEEHGVCIGSNVGSKGCFVHPEVVIERETKTFGKCDKEFGDPKELLNSKILSLVMFGSIREARELEEAFPFLKLLMFSGNVGADIVKRGDSKAAGIQVLLNEYCLEWKDVVAFGDSMNDMDMIEMAGLGIAMGNAVEELKEKADFITASIEQDGVRYALEKYGFV